MGFKYHNETRRLYQGRMLKKVPCLSWTGSSSRRWSIPLQRDVGLSDVQVGLLEGFETKDKLFSSLVTLCTLRAHFVKA